MKLAVCDDEKNDLDNIANIIKDFFAADCEISKYKDAESLLEDSHKQFFDVLFLDIDLPDMNGMQLAERIRDENEYVKIIFITNREDCVYKGYKYNAFRFIAKNSLEDGLTEALTALSRYYESKNNYVTFKTQNNEITRNIDNIQYLEVHGHDMLIKYNNNTEKISGTMSQYEKLLTPKGFIRIHKSFLVNYRYIYSIEKNDVKLNDGTLLPLSRKRINETKNKLQIYTRSFDEK